MNGLTVGSLFAGIGGFDLGFERAGMRTVWFCEQDEFCRRVLAKHWPGVPCYPDVRALVADAELNGDSASTEDGSRHFERATDSGHERSQRGQLSRVAERSRIPSDERSDMVPVPVPPVDILCGGFPCQDLSYAGKGAGIDGARSGLWAEFARLIGDLRPRYVVIENVPALLSRGGDRVLADLAACGFDAEWDCLPASAFGAPHRRDRVWIVAYPQRDELRLQPAGLARGGGAPLAGNDGAQGALAYPDGERLEGAELFRQRNGQLAELGDCSRQGVGWWGTQSCMGGVVDGLPRGLDGPWDREPAIPRVAIGVPQRVDRLRALGNSLIPQIAEWIGRRILEWEAERMREAA